MEREESANLQLFRDCLATLLVQKSEENQPTKQSRKTRKSCKSKPVTFLVTEQKSSSNLDELAEFIDYTAHEIFIILPPALRTITYSKWLKSPTLKFLYPDDLPRETAYSILNPLPPDITDSLTTYSILPPLTSLAEFLTPVLISYVALVTAAPPPPRLAKDLATECEICERNWVPLTYHHLIPREVHGKALKRGWHTEDHLNDAAWVCRACHSHIHKVATNEELARHWYTVEKLLEREDVRSFAAWMGKVRAFAR